MTEPVATAEPSRLPTLTSLRWYAALLVFLYHFLQWSDLTLLRPLGDGYVGVTFFFVLSGFVLSLLRHPASIYLGEVSFAFYLTHQVVLIGIHAGPGDSEAHKLIALAAAFVVALAAAAALQALVEKPARSWLLRYAPRAAVTR